MTRHRMTGGGLVWLFFLVAAALPRLAAAGGLSFLEIDAPPPANVNNALKDVTGLAVSADGANVYAAQL